MVTTKYSYTSQWNCSTSASRGGRAIFVTGSKAQSLCPLSCHQALTEASAARGLSLHGSYSHPIPAILCFSGGCQPAGISSSTHEHHTCTSCSNPSAEKRGASRQTYSSPSRQSSPRSRSSHYTSGQHKPRTWGDCSRKSGVLGGCGASHLQGHTQRTWWTPPGTATPAKTGMARSKVLPGHFPCRIKWTWTNGEALLLSTQEICPRFLLYLVCSPGWLNNKLPM